MRSAALGEKIRMTVQRVAATREGGLYAYFREIVSESGGEATLASGRRVLMLGSNSYLGLSRHPAVCEAAAAAARRYGTGCGGSAVLNGTLRLHKELEEALAAFVGKEAAMVFPTGFQTNQGLVTSLAGRHDVVLMDRLNHASLVDAARLSYAGVRKYRHNDMADLERHLAAGRGAAVRWIVVDGVFSMDGDIVDLPGTVGLAERYEAAVLVDDAHGIGVLGATGRGTSEAFALTDRVDVIMGTFSKALASVGGFAAAAADVVEHLRHTARAGLFSASLPPASVAAARAALGILEAEPERRERLWANTRHLRDGLVALGFSVGATETPVIPVILGADERVFAWCVALEEAGVFVNPVVSPAVAPGHALLRLSVTAEHDASQLDRALEAFALVRGRLGDGS